MKIKVTNTQTIEFPDDMTPEDAAALFENPGAEVDDDDLDDEEDDDLDDEDDDEAAE